MDRESEKPATVIMVRASVVVPAELEASTSPELLRQTVRDLFGRAGYTVRACASMDLTAGLATGAVVEPADPLESLCPLVPEPGKLAEAYRIVGGAYREASGEDAGLLLIADAEHLIALAAEVERWRARAAARLETSEGRALFEHACRDLLGGALAAVAVEQTKGGA